MWVPVANNYGGIRPRAAAPACRSGPRPYPAGRPLERELGGELNESRRGGGCDLAERRAHDVAVHGAGAVELRVVEDVERFEANLEVPRLVERDALDQREVEVLDARPVEEPARRVAELAERRHAEARGVERRPLRRIVIDLADRSPACSSACRAGCC